MGGSRKSSLALLTACTCVLTVCLQAPLSATPVLASVTDTRTSVSENGVSGSADVSNKDPNTATSSKSGMENEGQTTTPVFSNNPLDHVSGNRLEYEDLENLKELPPFSSAVAYGSIHPEDKCTSHAYNPNLRLMGSMLVLLFPIVFYAFYKNCFTGGRSCLKKGMSSTDTLEEEVKDKNQHKRMFNFMSCKKKKIRPSIIIT